MSRLVARASGTRQGSGHTHQARETGEDNDPCTELNAECIIEHIIRRFCPSVVVGIGGGWGNDQYFGTVGNRKQSAVVGATAKVWVMMMVLACATMHEPRRSDPPSEMTSVSTSGPLSVMMLVMTRRWSRS